MVLAEPAVSDQGTTVCGVGTELSDSLIGRMENFGVARLTVEGHPVKKSGEDKSLAELEAELDTRFSHHAAVPLMMEIKGVFRERLHERIREMEGGDVDAAPPAE